MIAQTIHVMVDIETTSTRPNAIPWQIAAAADNVFCSYSEDKLEFNDFINYLHDDRVCELGHIDSGTIGWQLNKNATNWRNYMMMPKEQQHALATSLLRFNEWFNEVSNREAKVLIWGNAPSFDLSILKFWYTALGVPIPWKYDQEMCYRTLRQLKPLLIKKPEGGHDAMFDAKWQLKQLQGALKYIADN